MQQKSVNSSNLYSLQVNFWFSNQRKLVLIFLFIGIFDSSFAVVEKNFVNPIYSANTLSFLNSHNDKVLATSVTVTGTPTGFSYNQGEGPSAYQTIVVSGNELTSDITITAPINYEISTTLTFTVPLSVIALPKNASNNVTSTNIYIRLKTGLSMGIYNGNLTVATTGFSAINRALTGNVNSPVAKIKLEGNLGSFPTIVANVNTPIGTDNTLFAAQPCNSPAATKSFRIQNLGGAALTVNSIVIGGLHPSDFTVSSPTIFPFTIPAGSVVVFEIAFSPKAAFERLATVNISNNSVNNSSFIFNIKGTGNNAEIELSGNGVVISTNSLIPLVENFTLIGTSNTTSGTSIAKTFKVANLGNLPLDITSITLSGTDASSFSIVPTTLNVQVGKIGVFTIIYSAVSEGVKNAIVSIANNDLTESENPYTFAIQGSTTAFTTCSTEVLGSELLLKSQDFESLGLGWSYTATNYTLSGASQYSVLTGSTGESAPSAIGTQSFQVNNNSGELLFANVDTSNFVEVNFSFRLGSFSTVLAVSGADSADFLLVEISNDGGLTYIPEVKINANAANRRWSFGSTGISSTNLNYNLDLISSAGAEAGISTINITNLPQVSNLKIRITLLNNDPNEIWVIDNVTLKGKNKPAKITTSWNGSTWSNGIPTSSTKAIIDGIYDSEVVGSSISACSCEITALGEVSIGSNDTFEIQDDLVNNGTITIKDSGSLLQHNDNALNSGTISMTRIAKPMYRYDYTYWSSPISGNSTEVIDAGEFSLNDLSPNTLGDKYFKWNETTQTFNIIYNGNAAMVPGRGYIIRAPQSYNIFGSGTPAVFEASFSGKPNNGVIVKSVEGASTIDPLLYKYNLLGNPYPSALDAAKFLAENTNLGGTLYFWTHNTSVGSGVLNYTSSDYASWNGTGGTETIAAPSSSTGGFNNNLPLGFIAAGQAFFVRGITNGTSNVTFRNRMRIASNNNQFFRNDAVHANATITEKHRIWLNLTSLQNDFNQALIGYIEGATNDLDRLYDGEVFSGSAVTLYSILDTKNLTIQGRSLPFSETDEVPLGYQTTLTGTLTISLGHFDGLFDNQDVYLEDLELNLRHNLKESNYNFTTESGTFDNRFVLRYLPQESLNTEISEKNSESILIFNDENKISIASTDFAIDAVFVYDLQGRILSSTSNINANDFATPTLSVGNQVVIVKVYSVNKSIIIKKIIMN